MGDRVRIKGTGGRTGTVIDSGWFFESEYSGAATAQAQSQSQAKAASGTASSGRSGIADEIVAAAAEVAAVVDASVPTSYSLGQ